MRERAIEKLQKELENAKDKSFVPVIEHLIKRCEEDAVLAEDVLKEKKTWAKCFEYLYKKAREMAEKGARGAMVRDDIVYKWAEDYFHEVEVEKPEPVKTVPKTVTKTTTTQTPYIPKAVVSKPEPPKKKGEVAGQLDMFALLGL